MVEQPQPETIGERLRRIRLERGLSQRDLSGPGISYAYISRVEAGLRNPSVKALRMLAAKLGVTADYLERGTVLGGGELRELRLTELELRIRLDDEFAVDELNEILAEATEHADHTAAARVRVALGLAASARSDHAETVEQLEAAIASDLVSPVARPDVYATLGRAYAARGAPRTAVALFERVLAELEEIAPQDEGLRIRFASYLSFALTDAGDLPRAQAVVREALSQSSPDVDPYTRVRLYWSLGRLSIERAKPLSALDSFRRAVTLLEATEDTLHLARAHMNCTMALIEAEELDQAEVHLDQAQLLLGRFPADDDLVSVRILQALLAAKTGDHDAAEKYGNEGLMLARELPNEQGQLWWALAESRSRSGEDGADEAYQAALELLGEHGTVREHANLLRSYGRYLRSTDRDGEALDVFERAAEVASNLQRNDSAAER
jgi:transcriptional regulator with XRE-family HTH domain